MANMVRQPRTEVALVREPLRESNIGFAFSGDCRVHWPRNTPLSVRERGGNSRMSVTAQVGSVVKRPGCLRSGALVRWSRSEAYPARFRAVDRTERITAKSFAPFSARNPPEIF